MPFYPAADRDVQPAPGARHGDVPVLPGGGISRSIRTRRYPSDMSQAEWAVCKPLLPAPAWLAGRGGRPVRWCMRDIVDAIRYLTHNGPVWRALPRTSRPPGPCTGGRINGRPMAAPGGCVSGWPPGAGRRAQPRSQQATPSRQIRGQPARGEFCGRASRQVSEVRAPR